MEITDNKSNYGQQNKTLKTMVVIQNFFSNRTIFNMKQQPAIPEQMTIMFFLENQKLLNELLNYFLMNQKHTERPLLSDVIPQTSKYNADLKMALLQTLVSLHPSRAPLLKINLY